MLTTTLGGLGTQRAFAAVSHHRGVVHKLASGDDPAQMVFSYGDDLESVTYFASFVPEARDNAQVVDACAAVFADQPRFDAALLAAHDASIPADLNADAEPVVEFCFNPLSGDEDAAGRAFDGFAAFHERAFDFAADVAHK